MKPNSVGQISGGCAMAETKFQGLISLDHNGPTVNVSVGVDCHLEPEGVEQVNLGVSNFNGWSRFDIVTLSKSLLRVAEIEANEPFGGQGCYDATYIEGLSQYVELLVQLGENAPLNPLIIESALRHGFYKSSDSNLKCGIADLYANGSEQIHEFISAYLVCGKSASGERIPLNQGISDELSSALATSLDSLVPSSQAKIVSLFRQSSQQENSKVVDAVINLARVNPDRQFLVQAVLFLKDSHDPRVEAAMRSCWNQGKATSAADGVAIAFLLGRYPEDRTLRAELRDRQNLNYGVNREFSAALFDSNVPGAVALALDRLDCELRIERSLIRPAQTLFLAARNMFAKTQTERDLNTIAYYLGESFSGHSEREVAQSLKTLLQSGHERSIKFVRQQLESAPNKARLELVAKVINDSPL